MDWEDVVKHIVLISDRPSNLKKKYAWMNAKKWIEGMGEGGES